ncbi:MutS-related protein [Pseudobacteroides cellulosolvens]|uniref:DNA mismatch repair protein MutS domain protein n=1 Tax=Pseudobacteroides cellulosolvens ATCC 35603 = DSM 2933 TaxID=398512 RepID=A0A0L6JJY6_9FIRM|nr:hypothetical protein [Pseudobacteroides cellulosolvens]KNY26065.1 DNA mismatch repair protein MutS domain protein [Pseudobacteroides cellulosolvens ATCC 35603 = DSM 2933]
MDMQSTQEQISLIWPNEGKTQNHHMTYSHVMVEDMALEELAKAINFNNRSKFNAPVLMSMFTDDAEIINYRLEIIEDFINNPELASELENLLPMLTELSDISPSKGIDDSQLLRAVKRLGELDLYVKCIQQLHSVLSSTKKKIKSKGLIKLQEMLKDIIDATIFRSLAERLPKLRANFEGLSSVTVGINLDAQLRPVEATLLSINKQKFKGEPFLEKIFNKKKNTQDFTGIAELHSLEDTNINWGVNNASGSALKLFSHKNSYLKGKDPISSIALTQTLFNDLKPILENTIKPISSEIAYFTKINSGFLAKLEPELRFFIGSAKFIARIQALGLHMCRPEIVSKEQRIFNVEGIYNINLALSMHYKQPSVFLTSMIVTNEVNFDNTGRIFILTGPNRGGKTTYTQAIGLTQIMAQIGLYIPASKAKISPVDMIYTHFPTEEKPDSNLGRLGEESRRLEEIFKKATRYSLVLLNESLSSTSAGESLYIAKDIVCALKLLGVRAVFATHLHDLALDLDFFNKNKLGDSRVISLVSGVYNVDDTIKNINEIAIRTYKIIPGPPLGNSYARDIASRFGISLDNLVKTLKERDVIDKNVDIKDFNKKK